MGITPALWVLVHRGGFPWRPVMAVPGYVAAFSTHERAAAFGGRADHPKWEFRVLSRQALAPVIEGFRGYGARGVCLDPTADTSGVTVEFDDLTDPDR